MNRIAFASLAFAPLLGASPAHALTNDNGVIVFTQADVNNGGITPGDTPGFPATITQPGSYRLGSNLTVTTTANGIEARANEVSIDMNGFTLAGSGAGRNGIASFNRALRVTNGNIRGFTNDGVRSIAQFLTVTNMVITANGRHGVFADSSSGSDEGAAGFARISDSNVSANHGDGIDCGRQCHVDDSIVSTNEGRGILFYGSNGMALGNTLTDNKLAGVHFSSYGAAGNNTVISIWGTTITGNYLPMQPNACFPACTAAQ